MHSYEATYLTADERRILKKAGLFIYDERDGDGCSYTIAPHVVVNNIGTVVTDTDLSPYMKDHEMDGAEFEQMVIFDSDFRDKVNHLLLRA